jgi:hypothetical protein
VPNIYRATDDQFVPATMQVFRNAVRASHLTLLVLRE